LHPDKDLETTEDNAYELIAERLACTMHTSLHGFYGKPQSDTKEWGRPLPPTDVNFVRDRTVKINLERHWYDGARQPQIKEWDLADLTTPDSQECDPVAWLRRMSVSNFRFRVNTDDRTFDIELFYLPITGGEELFPTLFSDEKGDTMKPFGNARLLVFWEGRWLPLASLQMDDDDLKKSWLFKPSARKLTAEQSARIRGIVHSSRPLKVNAVKVR
jgi:hypothetical protein